MGSILVLVGLFFIVLTSRRTGASAPAAAAESADWGEKEDIWRWNVEDYPNPQSSPKFCHRFAPSNVCDPDEILKKEQADKLDSAIRRLYNDTPCLCPDCSSSSGGIIIGIAVMKNIFLPYNEHPSKIIQEFAEELRKRWSLGRCKNDIVIVLVTGDRMTSTSVGPGISSYVSPEVSRIFHDNKGYFTIGSYYEGLMSMVQAYYDLSRSLKFEEEIEEVNIGFVAGVVVGVVMLLVLIILVGCTLRRRMSSPPSLRKDSWNGDPSLSWKKAKYKPCNTGEEKEKVTSTKRGDTLNNNDRVINTGALQERITDKGDETIAQNDTLLTTVAEFENEDNSSTKEESAGDHETAITNVNEKNELSELQYIEPAASLPAPQTSYKGIITNI